MRLPRQDTPRSLPAEPPKAALAADEALLETAVSQPPAADEAPPATALSEPLAAAGKSLTEKTLMGGAERSDRACRWWTASSPAVVVGLGLHNRLAEVVDLERCEQAGVEVLERRAGGGALLLDRSNMLCGAIAVATTDVPRDVTESYRWLGDRLVSALAEVGVHARRIEVHQARDDVALLRKAKSQLLNTCFGALSPHEVLVDNKKLVGLAQVRRRDKTLYQLGILLEDQSPLADFLRVPDELTREALRRDLKARTVGLSSLTDRSASAVAWAIADAMPGVP